MAAVLSEDTLDTENGYIFTFHEFVHCYQGIREEKLKSNLSIYQKAMKNKDYMWEIQHPFPYEDENFLRKTKELGRHFEVEDTEKIQEYYKYMKDYLDRFDFEYMIWQQWKEGYARYVENKIRVKMGFGKNIKEIDSPFYRISFYEIGSRYIEFLVRRRKRIKCQYRSLIY